MGQNTLQATFQALSLDVNPSNALQNKLVALFLGFKSGISNSGY